MKPTADLGGFLFVKYNWGSEKRDLDGSIIINAHCHVLCEGDIITLHVLSTVNLHENSSLLKSPQLTSSLFVR